MRNRGRRQHGRIVFCVVALALVAAGCGHCFDPSFDVGIKTLTVSPQPIECVPGSIAHYTISWTLTAPVHRMILTDDAPLTTGSRTTDLDLKAGGIGRLEHAALCPKDGIGSFPVYLTATDQRPDGAGGHSPTDAHLVPDDGTLTHEVSRGKQVTFLPAHVPGAPVITEFTVNGSNHATGTCHKSDPPVVDVHWNTGSADRVTLDGNTVPQHDTVHLSVACGASTAFTLVARNAYGITAEVVSVQLDALKDPAIQVPGFVPVSYRPIIDSFTALPQVGGCGSGAGDATSRATTLTWATTGADTVSLIAESTRGKNKRRHFTAVQKSGSQALMVSCGKPRHFTLIATNAAGTTTQEIPVWFSHGLSG